MSLFNLSGYLGVLSPSTATVVRYATSYASTGKANARSVATMISNVKCSAQPQGKRLDRDPEGTRTAKDKWTLFVAIELFNGDRVTIDGQAYEVENVEPWNALGGYCEATAHALDGWEA